MIQKHVQGDPDILFARLSKIRNAIMHGDEIKSIEKDLSISLADYIDIIGKVAWTAILNFFLNTGDGEEVELNFIDVNKYVHHQLTTKLHMKMGCPDKDNPQIEKMPMVEIKMIQKQLDNAGETI